MKNKILRTIPTTFQKILLLMVFIGVTAFFAVAAIYINKLQHPKIDLISLLVDKENKIVKVFFSPDNNPKEILIGLINSEKKSICVAIYTLTEKDISQALINAFKRGVKVEVVADRCYACDKASRIYLLANNKIPIWIYQTSGDDKTASLMHNKFCIFEDNILNKSIVWSGSYNFTKRASFSNQENVLILDTPEIVVSYSKQFDILKSRSLLISGEYEKAQPFNRPIEKKWYEIGLTWLGFVR